MHLFLRDAGDFDESGDESFGACPHEDHSFDDRCPDCLTNLFVLVTEIELRVLSLDLWVAGWTPDELVEHVRRSVRDPRAADLVAHTLLVDDSHRSDHARPPEWREQVERLRAAVGAGPDTVRPGWLARWVRATSSYESSSEIAEVLGRTVATLSDLVAPALDGP